MKNDLINNFKLYFPSLAEKAVDFKEDELGYLFVRLDSGMALVYDDENNSFRVLPVNSNNMSEEEHRQEFGVRLRKLLYRKGISQEDLSLMTGIPQSRISNYIRGKYTPSFYVVDKIAKALGCSTEDLRYTD